MSHFLLLLRGIILYLEYWGGVAFTILLNTKLKATMESNVRFMSHPLSNWNSISQNNRIKKNYKDKSIYLDILSNNW